MWIRWNSVHQLKYRGAALLACWLGLIMGGMVGAATLSTLSVGAAQLTLMAEQVRASLNGQSITLSDEPKTIGGRTMVPLREVATLLAQPVNVNSTQVQVGRLSVNTSRNMAYLDGVPQPGQVVSLKGTLYISARLLADALGAQFSVDPTGRLVTLTAVRAGGNPLAPQARFSTDKMVYAPGERIIYTEYPFDPDGAEIMTRRWTGKQDAFFQPGTYTITFQVVNARGVPSTPYSRTIRVEGLTMDTPLTYALKYGDLGDAFSDPQVLSYPAVPATAQTSSQNTYPLLFSDSPEAPTQSGVLYQDVVSGRSRLLAYHVNALGRPARLYVMARNLDGRPVEVRTSRLGETAPTRIEGMLGQVTLLDYFAQNGEHTLQLEPGQLAPVYASPTLAPSSGVSLLQDIESSGRVELSFVMLEDTLPPTDQVLQQLPYLPLDGKHQRGTFSGAVRSIRVQLGALPARLHIGDGQVDPALVGVDKLTGQPMRLSGNYGVLYDLEILGASNTAIALSPRGGFYQGAMHIEDGPLTQTIKLPRSGHALVPNQPVLLWRPLTDRLNIDFIPASGSNLPISLVFYRAQLGQGLRSLAKPYSP